MNKLPPKYDPNIPRVSSIVERAFPFKGTEDEKRFHMWLRDKGVDLFDYMKEASTWGTYIHSMLESFCINKKIPRLKKEYKDIVMNGVLCIQEREITPIDNEVYIRTKKLQWTADLIANMDWKKRVMDWKSYGLAKYKFGLDSWRYNKPYSKLKKARLQLSIYAHALKIKNIAVIELDKNSYHFHELELMDKSEINQIIKEYYLNYLDEL